MLCFVSYQVNGKNEMEGPLDPARAKRRAAEVRRRLTDDVVIVEDDSLPQEPPQESSFSAFMRKNSGKLLRMMLTK